MRILLGMMLTVGLIALACSGETTYTPTTEPVAPAVTVIPPTPIELSGEGKKVERITLVEGLWTIDASVTNNQDCSFGSCLASNFIIKIESAEDTGMDIIANEITEDWSGSATLRVGGLLGLPAGKQIVSVNAEGAWTIRFTLE